MDIINNAILYLLMQLHTFVEMLNLPEGWGGYGLAIVLITVILRVLLWPLNTQQAKSMKKMKELQPKLKEIQTKYKDNPQKLQENMFKMYKDHNFNPLAGCLPMLIQLPIFIGLYGALSSPDFFAIAGNESFLFINNLQDTLHGHAGENGDNMFDIEQDAVFVTAKKIQAKKENGEVKEFDVRDQKKILDVKPSPMIPGEPAVITINVSEGLGQDPDYFKDYIKSVDVLVMNEKSREFENLTFENDGKSLTKTIKTNVAEGGLFSNMDVLILLIIYAVTMLLYQKTMSPGGGPKADGASDPQAAMQEKMMKILPIAFVGIFFIVPIPAGALLYIVVTMLAMAGQTFFVNMMDDKKDGGKTPPSKSVVDVKAE